MHKSIIALLVLALAGCGAGQEVPGTGGGKPLRTAADPLSAGDVDRFLAVVQSRAEPMIPEFTPADGDDDEFEPNAPAAELVESFRAQFARLFDAERQGRVWARDEEWSQALAAAQMRPDDFAALVRSVGCAVMRVRLEARVDLERLVGNARAQVDEIVESIEQIDNIPVAEQTRDHVFQRNQAAMRLGRAVALLEFAETVAEVPSENAEIVRRYARQIKPLLSSEGSRELLAELQELGSAEEDGIEQAGFEEPAEE